MLEKLAATGEIPQTLCDKINVELDKSGKLTKPIYGGYLRELEKLGLFDVQSVPFDAANSAKTDGTYVYKRPKNPFWHLAHWFWSALFKLIGFVAAGIVFGVWRVRDRRKIKKIGACITTSNHVGYLDAVLTRRALGARRQHIVVAPYNCKYTVGGAILRSATVLPLPINLSGTRAFNDMLRYATKRGAAIHFYPEKSMWVNYKKPRPHKEGAAMYAEMLGVPIVPMLYCFETPRGLRRLLHLKKAVIKIGEPQYVDTELAPRKRRHELATRVYNETKRLYEEFYGVKLEYLRSDDEEPKNENQPKKD